MNYKFESNRVKDYGSEENFYDNWVKEVKAEKINVEELFTAITAPENEYILKYLGPLKGKRILEVGCGFGEASVYFAKKGARVVASDISQKMVDFVKKLSKLNGVETKVLKFSCNRIPFPDNSFDVVYAANVLHHVDIESSVKEIKRVLKKGGSFVAWDPLIHNPLINVYRKKAFKVRTKNEHPLKLSEVITIRSYFRSVRIRYTWFLTLWIFIKYYLIDRVDVNRERYWKKVIVEADKLRFPYLILERIDRIILKIFPILHKYCWNVVIMGKK
ncbi:MAG: Methyltransferase, UbiE/COQ5 family [Candidatus Shapirobacteria bacterium GW2011_GWE1_38_10]|uniref:Methyltransferase, UbiE/COQ5 family n=1 Tax=Candidatus Shapirobacteria bacterium GW2011_GWE1_38_10 TaxID=1618488 RepID=A0A0G0I674_9BACT|nr:MAG: Methyltransferase, UbiE/COQ5 family [Candidatus Shapirobacteria bacterium GW2011_GWF2_37_20]KKQ50057.1 MAG: Methyltransferase, UbiE/COQ5 family [Candidatus Shapirobacteria bacterium GW2011_GWE1_38_10]KKQ64550.1 MAG: Methyltransferase, UbiE/COQ5 family [Candidatus Shapirobacteria bacterium GW2011_GWF1_38_23]HBP51129.1 SAM-dependent methyltransferase [Candidatus Shapirobacteria bacterium]